MVSIWKILFCVNTNKGAVQASGPHTYPDFDPNAKPEHDKTVGRSLQAAESLQIIVSEDFKPQRGASQPPPYSLDTRPSSVHRLLALFQEGLGLGKEQGISGAFNVLRHRHFHVWIDDNYRLPRTTKKSIQVMALLLLLLGKAIDGDMEFFFMSQSNTDSDELTDAQRQKAKALDELWRTQSWREARALVERSSILQNMGLVKWINDNSPEGEEIQRTGQGVEGQRMGGYGQPQAGVQPVAAQEATQTETPNEKFARLLDHVRNLKIQFWQGYDQRHIDLTGLQKEHKSALRESKKQPKSLNSVRFTFEREIGYYTRLLEGNKAGPTTVLLLTGSPLQPVEADAVIKLQKDNSIKKGGKMNAVRGQGSQFCIQTMAWTKHMDEEAKQSLRKMDDAFMGDNDVNDVTEVDDEWLLANGPSAKLLYKVLNSNNKGVDSMRLKTAEDKYGMTALVKPGDNLTMPTFKEVAKMLGQDEGDSDEEDEGDVAQE